MATRRSEISHVILRNGKDDNGQWIDLHISIGSWVTMMPSQVGEHAVKKQRLNDLTADYKGQVLGFVMSQSGQCIHELLIAHAKCQGRILQRLQHFQSLNRIAFVLQISRIQFPPRASQVYWRSIMPLVICYFITFLCIQGVWFHKYHYTKPNGKVGNLTLVGPPTLHDMSKGIADVHILTPFRCSLAREVGKILTERGGVRGGAKAFIPINIFALLFKDVQTLRTAPQTYTFQGVSETSLDHIFYGEWRKKFYVTGGQTTLCEVDTSNFVFRYRLPKQTLYCNFFVQRKKKQWESGHYCWKAVEDHCIRTAVLALTVHLGNGHIQILNVEDEWTLFECRKLLESLATVSEFYF